MIEQVEKTDTVDRAKETARITLLLCYVKRRCNLFFREMESDVLPADEITIYVDELAEMADYSNVKTITTSKLIKQLPIRQATLFYDFFYTVLYWATWLPDPVILVNLETENGNTVLRLLPAEDAYSFQMDKRLENAIVMAGGTYTVKDIGDETASISLSFTERN
jgi:hypothetical protein